MHHAVHNIRHASPLGPFRCATQRRAAPHLAWCVSGTAARSHAACRMLHSGSPRGMARCGDRCAAGRRHRSTTHVRCSGKGGGVSAFGRSCDGTARCTLHAALCIVVGARCARYVARCRRSDPCCRSHRHAHVARCRMHAWLCAACRSRDACRMVSVAPCTAALRSIGQGRALRRRVWSVPFLCALPCRVPTRTASHVALSRFAASHLALSHRAAVPHRPIPLGPIPLGPIPLSLSH